MIKYWIGLAVCLATLSSGMAAETPGKQAVQDLDQQVQKLKEDVLDLNRDLFLLEEELLFPASTQVSVFLSLDVGKFLKLNSVQVKIDDKVVANHLYTERDIKALEQGGVQRLFVGNYRSGKHELVAFIYGVDWRGRKIKLGTDISFEKKDAAKYVELKITDEVSSKRAKFAVREWE